MNNAISGVFVVSVVCGSMGCAKEQATTPAPAPTIERGPVVYGEDGRVDWYAIGDEGLRRQVHDTAAAMIPWDYLASADDGSVAVDGDPPLGESYGLCADQRFRDQPTAAECSGTLIAPDLVMTAGHCEPDLDSCASSAWVFDYLYTADGVRAPVTQDSVYGCVDVLVTADPNDDDAIDIAIVQLDRPVVGRVPAEVAKPHRPLVRGDGVTLVGFPSGIQVKVDAGGTVWDPRASQDDYFVASVDSFAGNSGSGVLGAGHAVIGVLVTGADDYVNAGSCEVVNVLDPTDAQEGVMYAHRAMEELCAKGWPDVTLCPDSPAPTCGDGFCTGSEKADGCAADCGGLFAVPPEWTCSAAWYGAGDDCDCGCGAPDPDCANHTLDVVGCAPGSACNPDGTCKTPIPEAWTCGTFQYGDGRRCDCDCGAPDPDCADAQHPTRGCAPGGQCQADGTCTASIAAGWECSRRFYDAGDGCDCDCGAFDPDCADPAQQVYGCVPGTACQADGTCAEPLPSAWLCDGSTYAAGDACDCNCGMPDPDCATSTSVRNCHQGEVCSEGTCVAGPAEPEPEAGPEAVEAVEVVEVVEVVEADEVDASDAGDVADTGPGDGADADASDAGHDAADATSGDAIGPGDAAEAESKTGGKHHDSGCAGGGAEGLAGLGAGLAVIVRRRAAGARLAGRRTQGRI